MLCRLRGEGRRGNDRVMTRGSFANVRIKNLMATHGGKQVEGGYTQYFGDADVPTPDTGVDAIAGGKPTFIFDACMAYKEEGRSLIVIAGADYGMGSSRDWAAKGTLLLGVKAVVATSFERIHRSNLIGMGVLPLDFVNKADYDKVASLFDATFNITGLEGELKAMQSATLTATSADGTEVSVPLTVRLDTPAEIDYYLSGGILQYVLNQILDSTEEA